MFRQSAPCSASGLEDPGTCQAVRDVVGELMGRGPSGLFAFGWAEARHARYSIASDMLTVINAHA